MVFTFKLNINNDNYIHEYYLHISNKITFKKYKYTNSDRCQTDTYEYENINGKEYFGDDNVVNRKQLIIVY